MNLAIDNRLTLDLEEVCYLPSYSDDTIVFLFTDGHPENFEFRNFNKNKQFSQSLAKAITAKKNMNKKLIKARVHIHCVVTANNAFSPRFQESSVCDSYVNIGGIQDANIFVPRALDCSDPAAPTALPEVSPTSSPNVVPATLTPTTSPIPKYVSPTTSSPKTSPPTYSPNASPNLAPVTAPTLDSDFQLCTDNQNVLFIFDLSGSVSSASNVWSALSNQRTYAQNVLDAVENGNGSGQSSRFALAAFSRFSQQIVSLTNSKGTDISYVRNYLTSRNRFQGNTWDSNGGGYDFLVKPGRLVHK